ncbi:LacI family DNA-binding transcriptional regulator [Evansella sp. AB-P1]|uniref:LacI family DNA-binding transcriptional regulator n=1 Tax=Evansella sp. AB-P1 TaxID=3037653 RepID=UPI00241DFACF|nr:LacI family DNA-binding transcriptional regulator [Evansella sp. AB-P1]MDG5789277.1 LacI family DNA-binding transcriptional regulator [Evansella sp. AB-P1]
MATIRDVSKLAGVSVATVSRVINKNGYVNETTKNSVLNAIKALNYKPSSIARSLAGMKTSTIALLVSDILNPFFPEISHAIESEAIKQGYSVILCNSDNNAEKEAEYIKILKEKRIDGIMIASYTIQAEQIKKLQEEGIPVVVLDREFPGHNVLTLMCKNREGASMAVQHLIDQGCKKIGHISGPLDVYAARERAIGYEEVTNKNNIYTPGLIVPGGFSIDGGYRALLELYAKYPDIDGVFAGNDLMGIGAIKALYDSNLYVPKNIKVIGFDDIDLSKTFMPELSTIKQPIYEMSKMALHYLMKQINNEDIVLTSYAYEVELLPRESTKKLEKEA